MIWKKLLILAAALTKISAAISQHHTAPQDSAAPTNLIFTAILKKEDFFERWRDETYDALSNFKASNPSEMENILSETKYIESYKTDKKPYSDLRISFINEWVLPQLDSVGIVDSLAILEVGGLEAIIYYWVAFCNKKALLQRCYITPSGWTSGASVVTPLSVVKKIILKKPQPKDEDSLPFTTVLITFITPQRMRIIPLFDMYSNYFDRIDQTFKRKRGVAKAW